MIQNSANKLMADISSLIILIQSDIDDLKSGESDNMIDRNNQKQTLVEQIQHSKQSIDQEIVKVYTQGEDIEEFRTTIDNVESKLHELNKKNNELAYILLPLKDMYDNIIGDFFRQNQSSVDYSA